MTRDAKIYSMLALAGTIPFVAGAVMSLLGHDSLPLLGPLAQLVASYGLAIVCFLAGTHWGIYLSGRAGALSNLLVISNVVFLAAWFGYVGADIRSAMVVQIGAFAALLLVDVYLRTSDIISRRYFRVRSVVTLVAAVCLLVVILQ